MGKATLRDGAARDTPGASTGMRPTWRVSVASRFLPIWILGTWRLSTAHYYLVLIGLDFAQYSTGTREASSSFIGSRLTRTGNQF